MRIAFEVDGVLADMEAGLARERLRCFGPLDRDLRPDERAALSAHISGLDRFWETLNESEPGSTARLNTLAIAQRWHAIFLAVRMDTAGATAQRQTQRWLERHGVACPTTLVLPRVMPAIAGILELDTLVVGTDAWIGGSDQQHTRVITIDSRHSWDRTRRTSTPRPAAASKIERLDSLANCLALFEGRGARRRRWSRACLRLLG